MAKIIRYEGGTVSIPLSKEEVAAISAHDPTELDRLKSALVTFLNACLAANKDVTVGSDTADDVNTTYKEPGAFAKFTTLGAGIEPDAETEGDVLPGFDTSYPPIVRTAADALAWINAQLRENIVQGRVDAANKFKDAQAAGVASVPGTAGYYLKELLAAVDLPDEQGVPKIEQLAKEINAKQGMLQQIKDLYQEQRKK